MAETMLANFIGLPINRHSSIMDIPSSSNQSLQPIYHTPPPTAPPSHITQVQPKVQTLFPPSAPPMDMSDD